MTNQKNEPQGLQPLTTQSDTALSKAAQTVNILPPKNSNALLAAVYLERASFVQIIDWQAIATGCMTTYRRGDLLAHLKIERQRFSVVLIGVNNQPHFDAPQVAAMLTDKGIYGLFITGGRDAN
jgi:hypothetical protein